MTVVSQYHFSSYNNDVICLTAVTPVAPELPSLSLGEGLAHSFQLIWDERECLIGEGVLNNLCFAFRTVSVVSLKKS